MRVNGGGGAPRRHRIAEVLEEEGASIRTAAARFHMSQNEVRAELNETSDLTLSALRRWQRFLNVPLADLLREPALSLSPEVRFRSALLKAMRTVRSIQNRFQDGAIQILAEQLVQQLTAIMPELEHASAWPATGTPRTMNELGAIVDRQYSEELLLDPPNGD